MHSFVTPEAKRLQYLKFTLTQAYANLQPEKRRWVDYFRLSQSKPLAKEGQALVPRKPAQQGCRNMPNIVHRVGMAKVAPERVYWAVSTKEGFASLWTVQTIGQAIEGDFLAFRFAGNGAGTGFEVLELLPDKRAAFKCIDGPKEWLDTHLAGETILLFKHCGWREEGEFMHHCSTQWGYFLVGLKKFLEGGEGHPYGGNFEPISGWSK